MSAATKNVMIQAPGPAETLVVTEGAIPETPEFGLIVKVHCTGICHSDVHIWQNKFKMGENRIVSMEDLNPDFKWPFILGHEVAGEVYILGPQSSEGDPNLKVGDRVVIYPWRGCGTCNLCLNGESNICAINLLYDYGVGSPGGYQSFMPVLRRCDVVKMSDDLPVHIGCMFGCSALTSFNACQRVKKAIDRAVRVSGEANFLIIGAGGLGLWTIQMARAMFPQGTKIFIADVAEDKLKDAKEHGADETILWPRDAEESDIIEKTKEITGGIDGSIDFVGVPATFSRTFQVVKKGSIMVGVGLSGGSYPLAISEMILRDITLSGVYVGKREQLSQLMELYTQKKLKPPPLSKIRPDEVPQAVTNVLHGKVQGRYIIHFI